jgi:hypothetical protein
MPPGGTVFDSPSAAAVWVTQLVESRFAAGLDAARAARASGPRPEAVALRRAYLDLLKLCLCDLCGTSTLSVARTTGGQVMSRELTGDQLRFRAAGMDWPLNGLTMIGLTRLDDLQACVESVVADAVEGDLIETGTWRGGASMLMRATLDLLGAEERTVWVADSFQGFPASDEVDGRSDEHPPALAPELPADLSSDLAAFDFLAVPLEEVQANFARLGLERGVRFVPGFFEDTLPHLAGGRWSIIRLDGDTYEATRVALESLYPGLSVGGYVIVDDYLALDQCRQAVDEFRQEHGILEPIEEVDWSSVRWRRETGSPPAAASADGPGPTLGLSPRPMARPPRARVPAMEEVDLAHELAETRRRLASEVDRLTGSPLAGPKAWLGRLLRRARRSAE